MRGICWEQDGFFMDQPIFPSLPVKIGNALNTTFGEPKPIQEARGFYRYPLASIFLSLSAEPSPTRGAEATTKKAETQKQPAKLGTRDILLSFRYPKMTPGNCFISISIKFPTPPSYFLYPWVTNDSGAGFLPAPIPSYSCVVMR